jgi:hypothetical protein
MDGVNRQALLAAVDALRDPMQQRLVMDLPCQCGMAVAVGGDLQSVRRVPEAAMQRRLEQHQMPESRDARLPQTLWKHPSPRLGRLSRHDVLDGGRVAQTSRAVARPPLLRQPLAETLSASLVGFAITANARMLSVAIHCCLSMIAHARSSPERLASVWSAG